LDLQFVVTRIGFNLTDDLFVTTLFYTNVALFVWILASLTARPPNRSDTVRVATLLKKTTRLERLAFVITAALLAPLALYSLRLTLVGSTGLMMNAVSGITINTTSTGYINDAQYMLGGLVLLYLACFRQFFPSIAVVTMFFLVRMVIGHDRWTFVFAACSFVTLFMAQRGSFKVPVWAVAAVPPAMAVFTLIGQARDVVRNVLFGADPSYLAPSSSLIDKLNGPDIANFDFLAFIISVVPHKSGTYTYFTQWLQLLTEPIPRILWAEKPLGAPIVLVDLGMFGNFHYYSRGMVGDAYMSLGLIGIIAVTYFFGRWIFRTAARSFSGQRGKASLLMAIILMPLTVQWLRDGGVVSIAKFIMWNALPIFIWHNVHRFLTWYGTRRVGHRVGPVTARRVERPHSEQMVVGRANDILHRGDS